MPPRNNGSRRGRARPSVYHRVPLFIAIAFQLLASLAVAGIMFYFISHLHETGGSLPWMFYFLQGSALMTLITMLLLRGWSAFRSPIPLVCAVVSALLMGTWGAGLGLVLVAVHDPIRTPCDMTYWGNSQGVTVCILYKVLVAGAGAGFLSTIIMLILDIMAWRKSKYMFHTRNGEGLIGGPVRTEYKPVWSDATGHTEHSASLEPLRHG